MKTVSLCALSASLLLASTAIAQAPIALPADTVIQVVPVEDITSIHMNEGDQERLQVAADVVQNGAVVIPRGAPVAATVTWRTGKGIGGKSAKFDLTFNTVSVNGHQYALKGKHRQEGKGNTVAALLGSIVISGHSAVMESGQMVNAFTAEPIPVQAAAATSYDADKAAGQAAMVAPQN
jgi:hypothetical protein